MCGVVESSGWVCQGPSGRASVGRMDRDRSGCAVDGDELAVGQSAGGVDRADDRGEAVLPGDDGGVGQRAPAVGDQGSGDPEQDRPRRTRSRAHQDLAGQEQRLGHKSREKQALLRHSDSENTDADFSEPFH